VRTLLWKEWRENRVLVVAGLAIIVLVSIRCDSRRIWWLCCIRSLSATR